MPETDHAGKGVGRHHNTIWDPRIAAAALNSEMPSKRDRNDDELWSRDVAR